MPFRLLRRYTDTFQKPWGHKPGSRSIKQSGQAILSKILPLETRLWMHVCNMSVICMTRNTYWSSTYTKKHVFPHAPSPTKTTFSLSGAGLCVDLGDMVTGGILTAVGSELRFEGMVCGENLRNQPLLGLI